MASLQKLPHSPNWIAYFRSADGKLKAKSTGFRATAKNKVQALRMADAWEQASRGLRDAAWLRRQTEQLVKERGEESRTPATVRGFCEAWLEAKRLSVRASSLQSYQAAVQHLLDWLAGDAARDVLSLTKERLLSYRTHLATTRSPMTANNQFKVLRMIFRQARLDGVIYSDPAEGVARVKEARKEGRRPFTLEELRAVLSVAAGEWRGLVLFGLYTGQRLGDLARLTWENVDLATAGGQLRLVTVKTGRSQFIPLHTALRDYLAGLDAGDNPRACLFPRAAAAVDASGGKTGTLSNQFANILAAAGLRGKASHAARREGRDQLLARIYGVRTAAVQRWLTAGEAAGDACPADRPVLMPAWWGRVMRRGPSRGILDAAARYPDGVPDLPAESIRRGGAGLKKETARVSFHSLRHTATSLLKAAGIPASVVMDLIGHDDAAMSQHYTHTGDSERRRAVDALPVL